MTVAEKQVLVVMDAGGTISSRPRAGALAAGEAGALASAWRGPGRIPRFRTVHTGLSEEMTLGDAMAVVRAALDETASDSVRGVVVAHGTDTLEETAFLATLFHTRPEPIVFTGAQRAPDAHDYDGTRNLTDALAVAAAPEAQAAGVLTVFGGQIFDGRVEKRSTTALDAFAPRGGVLGQVQDGRIRWAGLDVRRPRPLPLTTPSEEVEIIALALGDPGHAIGRAVAAGARGLVIEALGRGNANAEVAEAVAQASRRGVPIAVVSRCVDGGVAPDYVTGRRLADAGGVFCGEYSAAQARLLLSVTLALHPLDAGAALRAYLAA